MTRQVFISHNTRNIVESKIGETVEPINHAFKTVASIRLPDKVQNSSVHLFYDYESDQFFVIFFNDKTTKIVQVLTLSEAMNYKDDLKINERFKAQAIVRASLHLTNQARRICLKRTYKHIDFYNQNTAWSFKTFIRYLNQDLKTYTFDRSSKLERSYIRLTDNGLEVNWNDTAVNNEIDRITEMLKQKIKIPFQILEVGFKISDLGIVSKTMT